MEQTILFNFKQLFRQKWFYAALLFAAAIFFINLGADGIYAAQEGRSAIIARQMLRSGDWMNMHFPGGIDNEKPIAYYWICAAFGSLFHLDGNPDIIAVEWAVRLPSALAALLTVLGAALLAGRIYGVRTACISVVVLSSMATFANLARLAHIDMTFAGAFTWSMVFLYFGYFQQWQANWRIYLFYLLLGLSVLFKGPLALLLAGLVVLGMLLWSRRWKMIWELRPCRGALLFLAVTAPWYIQENIRTEGAFFREFLLDQNIRRFTGIGSTYRNGERMPWLYYFPKLLAGALPWSLVSVLALIGYRKNLWKLRFRPDTVFLAMWVITGFLFFTLSALKRGDYLLPLYPALAILTARAIDRFCSNPPALHRRWQIVFYGIGALSLLMLALNGFGVIETIGQMAVDDRIPHLARRDGMTMIMIGNFLNDHLLWVIPALAVTLGVLFWFGKLLEKRKFFEVFTGVAIIILGIFSCYHAIIQPGTDGFKTVKFFAKEARQYMEPGKRLVFYDDFNTELIFFIDRPYSYVTTDEELPPCDYVLTDPECAENLLQRRPGGYRELLKTVENHQYPAVLLSVTQP